MNDDLQTPDYQTPTSSVSVSPQPGTNPGPIIKDTSTATFQADVIDPSATVPILVDFWAPWCGPCKQLGPALEKIVAEAKGKIRLVKINIDENQQLAEQMGVKSIPAVFSFSAGQPVDGFMGALPESELRKFVEKQIGAAPKDDNRGEFEKQVEHALSAAEKTLNGGDINQAISIYGQILQQMPENTKALCGVTRAFVKSGALEQAKQALALVPSADHQTNEYIAAKTALELANEAEGLQGADELIAKINADPENMQPRMDLAIIYNASGEYEKAANALIEIIKRDREWNGDAGRTKLLEFFEAWGPTAPGTIAGRKLLSRTLFS